METTDLRGKNAKLQRKNKEVFKEIKLGQLATKQKHLKGSEQLWCRAPRFAPKNSVFAIFQHYLERNEKLNKQFVTIQF